MIADITVDIEVLKVRMAVPDSIYDVVVCCHTATEDECDEIAAIANRARTGLVIVERFILPPELICQVSNLIRDQAVRASGRKE